MDLCQSRERADAILVSAAAEDKWRDADISLRFRVGQIDECLIFGVLCLFLCAAECVCNSLSHTYIYVHVCTTHISRFVFRSLSVLFLSSAPPCLPNIIHYYLLLLLEMYRTTDTHTDIG